MLVFIFRQMSVINDMEVWKSPGPVVCAYQMANWMNIKSTQFTHKRRVLNMSPRFERDELLGGNPRGEHINIINHWI